MTLNALTLAQLTAAGYKYQLTDTNRFRFDGVAEPDRYVVTLDKPQTGDPDGGSGWNMIATGVGSTSTTAKTAATDGLNGQRLQRYGADSGSVSLGKRATNAHTKDAT